MTLGGVMLLALFDVRRITAPLRQLTAAAERLSTGRFDQPISIGSADEIGELGRTLDAMRIQLRDFIHRERNMAILEERERIAAEMHDGLGQVLGFVIVKSLAIGQLVENGDILEARAQIDQLGAAAREAYADVRECILALRTTLAPDRDLPGALRAYVDGFVRQNDLVVELTVQQEGRGASIEPTAEVQLLRIIQEALTNVRKHAGAHHVTVRLTIGPGGVDVAVTDDGRGFEPGRLANSGSQHFGLQVMRERAESIGGRLSIQSEAGVGTRVTVSLPTCERGESDGPDTDPPRRRPHVIS